MTIREVCETFGLTADTLRYYEKTGVIPEVQRTKGGKRDYTEEDLNWVQNAVCFRGAGMPVEKLAEYVRLYKEGDETIEERLRLLEGVRIEIRENLRRYEEALNKLDFKIGRYEEALRTGVLRWDDDNDKGE